MKETVQRNFFNFLVKNGIEDFIGVPDSTMKYIIDEGLKKISMSGKKSLVFMQNAGFANSLSTITSLVQLYEIPMILLIGWRGYLKNDAPEHEKIGKIQPKLIKDLGLNSRILDEKNWKKSCIWAINELKKGKLAALIIKREFID